jgi:glycerol-3-phosphate dehydrogenase
MKRDIAELAGREYDLLVIGGGVYGVCTAWDAALRGLSVALAEKADFGHATSSNTLRVIHGGLRYLQHGDIRRLRRSVFERSTFMRIAPHLVHPLPFLIPTYGHLMRGKEIFSLALLLNHVVGFNGNNLEDPQKQLPRGRIISRGECLRLFPGIDDRGLTGAIITYDAQMYNSERLLLSIARSAAKAGAELANYFEVFGLLRKGDRVAGVKARDLLSGNEVDVRARTVVNTSGPWLNQILGLLNGHQPRRKLMFSKAFNLLVNRQIVSHYAIGLYSNGRFNDPDALLNKGSRLFFITPWHHRSLIGTVHLPYDADPDRVSVTAREAHAFLDELNKACPAVDLRRSEVSLVYTGLLPMSDFSASETQLLKRYQIYDHQREDGVCGFISVTGVKFTEARHVAERTVDLVFKKLGRMAPKPASAVTPVHGGHIERFQTFFTQETARCPRGLSTEAIQQLIYRYGSAYSEVLKYLDDGHEPAPVTSAPSSPNAICNSPASSLINAEIRYSMRQEMARKLADVIFRRTELGLAGNPGEACLNDCARIMSKELGWNATKTQNEINGVSSILARRVLTQ